MELPVPSWLEQLIGPGVVAVVLGFFGVRALNRIDALEQGKADKSDVKALIDEMRADREATRESRGKLYERVNGMAESLARLEGRLGK